MRSEEWAVIRAGGVFAATLVMIVIVPESACCLVAVIAALALHRMCMKMSAVLLDPRFVRAAHDEAKRG